MPEGWAPGAKWLNVVRVWVMRLCSGAPEAPGQDNGTANATLIHQPQSQKGHAGGIDREQGQQQQQQQRLGYRCMRKCGAGATR